MSNHLYVVSAVLMVLIGVIHTVLGEVLIFRRMRVKGLVPTNGGSVLQERHVRILWATWHLVTVLGFLVAALILWLAPGPTPVGSHQLMVAMVIGALMACSGLVLIGTKGRHPGWVGLFAVAVLVGIGTYA
jgi:drug/metabolite transporter (DMT)-like permease